MRIYRIKFFKKLPVFYLVGFFIRVSLFGWRALHKCLVLKNKRKSKVWSAVSSILCDFQWRTGMARWTKKVLFSCDTPIFMETHLNRLIPETTHTLKTSKNLQTYGKFYLSFKVYSCHKLKWSGCCIVFNTEYSLN